MREGGFRLAGRSGNLTREIQGNILNQYVIEVEFGFRNTFSCCFYNHYKKRINSKGLEGLRDIELPKVSIIF